MDFEASLDFFLTAIDIVCFGMWTVLLIILGFLMGRKTLTPPKPAAERSVAVNMGNIEPGSVIDDPWEEAQTDPMVGRITGDMDGPPR